MSTTLPMSPTVLRVAGISKRFGGLQALSDVGMTIERGQVYGLIGPNGAGRHCSDFSKYSFVCRNDGLRKRHGGPACSHLIWVVGGYF